MIYISKELIDEELQRDIENGFKFTYKKLSNKFLDWLFRHYYTVEMCTNSYDSEPVDYDEWKELRKTPEGMAKLSQIYRDYEPERIRNCNWQEPRFKGNWGMSQSTVDSVAKNTLKCVRNIRDKKWNRIYYSQKDNQIRIFIYGRDIDKEDIWFILEKR